MLMGITASRAFLFNSVLLVLHSEKAMAPQSQYPLLFLERVINVGIYTLVRRAFASPNLGLLLSLLESAAHSLEGLDGIGKVEQNCGWLL